jgi:hypothetical protein
MIPVSNLIGRANLLLLRRLMPQRPMTRID